MNYGKSIKLFLADGTPGGIITAEIMNWTGHVIAAPRSRLPDLLKRSEMSRPGLYVLLGDNPDEFDQKLAYIGESENIGERLTQHNRDEKNGGKDFWDRAFIITSKDANLTKGHLRFVESRLITIAQSADRIPLTNTRGTNREYGMLPEADIADMAFFIEQIKLVLPVLGLELLREAPQAAGIQAVTNSVPVNASPIFELQLSKHGIKAEAQEIDGEFVVRKGALVRTECSPNQPGCYPRLRQQLATGGKLASASSGLLELVADHVFTSPSAASSVILGRSDNGRYSWRVKGSGKSYAEWQEESLAGIPAGIGTNSQGSPTP